ncbi:MAG TPA: SIMPL domain-containing protein, partial [Aequorivita sp.]|nr:SIMPL domain-containing protein [Aequorivita sp.]
VSVLNQTVGKAVSISEFSNSGGPQPMYKMAMMDSSSGGGDQTIALGEMEIKTTVNVSFLLN